LFGRLGYDVNTPDSVFINEVETHFPEIVSQGGGKNLIDVWGVASSNIGLINQFFFHDWDFQWNPETCSYQKDTLYTVLDFMDNNPLTGSNLMKISDYANNVTTKGKITPIDVANEFISHSKYALSYVSKIDPKNNEELKDTLEDIQSFIHLGLYYSEKILAATDCALYKVTKLQNYHTEAVMHIENALSHWDDYTSVTYSHYNPQAFFARVGISDLTKLRSQAVHDIQLVKNLLYFYCFK